MMDPWSPAQGIYLDHGTNNVTIRGNVVTGMTSACFDSNPTYVDPGITCWAPMLTGSSPASNPPVSFPGIVGGWGAPGFGLPQSGTAPSWPHGC